MSIVINSYAFTSGPFSVKNISGITLWLDATTGLFNATSGGSAVTADAASVARWEDQSGNNRHATQSTTTARPALKTSVLNSKNIIRFDGTDDFVTTGIALGSFMAVSAHSVFVVGKAASVGTNAATSYENDAFYGDTGGYASIYVRSSGLAGTYNWDGNNDTATSSYTIGNNAMFYSEHSGGNLRFRLNGQPESSAASGDRAFSTTLQIGRQFGNNAYNLNGDIAELIMYNVAVAESDRQKVEGYLAHKWGLAGDLPAAHPYKNQAPE